MHQNESSDHYRLADLKAIQTSINIDTVGAENSQHAHVNVVDKTEVNETRSKHWLEERRYDNCSDTLVRRQDRHSRDCGHDKLVPPFQVDHIINEAE